MELRTLTCDGIRHKSGYDGGLDNCVFSVQLVNTAERLERRLRELIGLLYLNLPA